MNGGPPSINPPLPGTQRGQSHLSHHRYTCSARCVLYTTLYIIETMKSVLAIIALLIASASAFAPLFGARVESNTVCFAKHVQKKAAKWAKDKRPRKSRLSDINRTPTVYELHTMVKPAEYSISDAPPQLAVKPVKVAATAEE